MGPSPVCLGLFGHLFWWQKLKCWYWNERCPASWLFKFHVLGPRQAITMGRSDRQVQLSFAATSATSTIRTAHLFLQMSLLINIYQFAKKSTTKLRKHSFDVYSTTKKTQTTSNHYVTNLSSALSVNWSPAGSNSVNVFLGLGLPWTLGVRTPW